MSLLIFTDLDGTLLDHDDYSFDAARGALTRIRELGIPLVLATSKTMAEVLEIRTALDNRHPFLVENGALVAIPENYFPASADLDDASPNEGFLVKRFGAGLDAILNSLQSIRERHGFRFEGFSQWSDERLAALTNLPIRKASLARRRCCSEPILWEDDAALLPYFEEDLAQAGLRLVRGGRFHHVIGRFDKATSLNWILERFQSQYPSESFTTVALGDSPNDADMLEAVDIAVVIQSARSASVQPAQPRRVIRTDRPGPAGWQQAMEEVFQRETP